ncbi:Phenol 2-monooxygenase (NADPH) [Penicillium ucsense]|uniref:Phenol 2-monooxygenase (NADPH) n=1 Tax=Penicillium ucsense TaxID=2839758 RepID=A0A8J8W020_9EURO|nr:Phenol 2-monooxygenase (NADPH) [Penicillium ucsense]KAF7734583.1 Phenol 2-monooxygenase (NADPH) [Penicillium ucsense]
MNTDKNILESQIDVLIIGAGPSGLMAAYWMARCGVNARIVDKRGTKVFTGQADGLRCRTLEIFDSMGFQHRVLQEGHVAVEANFWVPDGRGNLIRQGPHCSRKVNESPFRNMLLNQGRIEQFLLDSIREHSDLEVERGVIAEAFEYDSAKASDPDAHPIAVTLRTLSDEEANPSSLHAEGGPQKVASGVARGSLLQDDWEELVSKSRAKETRTEIVRCKYVVGCDGAHSWTRKQVNIPLEGSSTDHLWGVIDVVPISNFPDMRRLGTVTHPTGTILVIPRERNMVRLYVPVQAVEANVPGESRHDRSKITLEMIKQRVQVILAPFTFDFKICDWWAAYQIGQRIAPTFSKDNRVFLAGDAVHTHSPKVGLGMNMSMQDGFNIGWKVALVAKGVAQSLILNTYDPERHRLAEMLLDFDRHWSGLFTESEDEEKAQSMIKVVKFFEDFADGRKSFYGASSLIWKKHDDSGPTASASGGCNLIPGERLPPVKLRMQADGNVKWTTAILKSDGRFRVVALTGDMRASTQRSRVEALAKRLSSGHGSEKSLFDRYTSLTGTHDCALDVLAIHSGPWTKVEFFDFPDVFHPFDTVHGWKYDKIWCDDACPWDRDCDGTGYERWGVDRKRGAIAVIRPDQYVGWVGELEDVEEMVDYLDGILVRQATTA